jgi:hypothetical protein
MGDRTGAYRVLVEKCERMRTPGRLRCRWEENNKMDLNSFIANKCTFVGNKTIKIAKMHGVTHIKK